MGTTSNQRKSSNILTCPHAEEPMLRQNLTCQQHHSAYRWSHLYQHPPYLAHVALPDHRAG